MSRYVITPSPKSLPNVDVPLPNLVALAYTTALSKKGENVIFHDWWESKTLEITPGSEVDIFVGYSNYDEGIDLFKKLVNAGINANMMGRYDLIDGQNFSDDSVLKEVGFQCKSVPNELRDLDYSLIENIEDLFSMQDSPTLSVITSGGGCPRRCEHCSSSTLKPFTKDAEQTIDEITTLTEKYNLERIIIADLLLTKQRIAELAEVNARWLPKIKISTAVNQIDSDSISHLGKLNCDEVFLGIETYNDRLLSYLGKPFGTKEIDDCVESLMQAGITPHLSLMLGIPGETVDSLNNTKEYVRAIARQAEFHKVPLKLQLSIATPVPGSRLYKDHRRKIGSERMSQILNSNDWITKLQQSFHEQNFDDETIKMIKTTYKELSDCVTSRYV